MGGPIFTVPVQANDDSSGSFGVKGISNFANSIGVSGLAFGTNGLGVYGQGPSFGVYGLAPGATSRGVKGICNSSVGVEGEGTWGVVGTSSHIGVWGGNLYGQAPPYRAGYFNGDVEVTGTLKKGGGSFKIDHPLDPANKYLSHSFVESPDMKNVYDGVTLLDDKGEAEIELPDWFGALNKDFRYQLTAIGAPGPNLYIAEEISDTTITNYSNSISSSNNKNSRFKIAGGTSDMKVSWQVTGIRKDPWANAHRIEVEEDKPDEERGYYIYPDLYDQPAEREISRLLFPQVEEERKKQELLINEQTS
jgi:hypothetical protein